MNRRAKLNRFRSPLMAILIMTTGIAGVAGILRFQVSPQQASIPDPGVRVQAASMSPGAQDKSGQADDSETPLIVAVDATRTAPVDPALYRLFSDAFGKATGQPAPADGAPSSPVSQRDDDMGGPNWFAWGRMSSDRALATLRTGPSDALPIVYAVHSQQGATIGIVNHTDARLPVDLKVFLPRGVYVWERLSVNRPTSAPDRVAMRVAGLRDGVPARAETRARLERLQSIELPEADAVLKPIMLEPGEMSLYRCTDVSRAARAAVSETRTCLEEMGRTAPDSARKLRRILDEGGDFLDYVCAGSASSRDRRVARIHHLLLITAQAHSLHHNFQARGTVSVEKGAATMGALERLTDGLAETSAAILGLVPQITVESDNGNIQASAVADGTQNVTVSIANRGTRSVDMVKIGVDASSLPPGTRIEPDDPAFFGTLYPGQTVRASFRCRPSAGTSVPANRCAGDVSYFVSGAPAHLRPRPW